jgi:hypothetical protein
VDSGYRGSESILLHGIAIKLRLLTPHPCKFQSIGTSPNFSPIEKIKAALHGIKVVSSISYAKGEERPYGNRVYNRTNGISATGAAPGDREI